MGTILICKWSNMGIQNLGNEYKFNLIFVGRERKGQAAFGRLCFCAAPRVSGNQFSFPTSAGAGNMNIIGEVLDLHISVKKGSYSGQSIFEIYNLDLSHFGYS